MGLVNALNTYLDEGQEDRRHRENLAQVNEVYYAGEQSWSLNGGALEYLWRSGSANRPTVHNHLASVVDAFTARLLRHNPYPTAYPVSAEGGDLTSAEVTNLIIHQRVNGEAYDDSIHRTVLQGVIHGVAGLKIFYDPDRDYVEWLPLTLFDFYLDPFCETAADARWVIFERHVSVREGEKLLRDAGYEDTPAVEVEYQKSPTAPRNKGVPLRELWLLPGVDEEFPEGLFCQYVGDKPLGEGQAFPYFMINGETGAEEPFLPISTFSPRPMRGTCYGATPLDAAIEPQKRLNHLESRLNTIEEITGNVKLKTSHRFAKIWNTRDQVLPMTSPEMQYTQWLRAPEIPELLLRNRVHYTDLIYKLFGLNETAAGQTGAKTHVSAKQVAFLSELDYQKSAGAHKSLRAMILRAWKMTLALMQKFYITDRLATFTGASDLEISHWKGSSLQGADITLQPTEGLEKYNATQGTNQLDRLRMGLEKPGDVRETSLTGLGDTQLDQYMETLVEGEIQAAMGGLIPNPQADPQVALRLIDRYSDLEGLSPSQAFAIRSLKDEYERKLQTMRSPAPTVAPPRGEQ